MTKTARTGLAVAAILGAAASVAEAQVSFRYQRKGDHWTLDFYYWSGYSYGYGYGYGFGGGYPGVVYSGSTYYGSGVPYSAYASGYGYGYDRRRDYAPYTPYADYFARSNAAWRASQHGVPGQIQKLTVDKNIELGSRKWRAGDYAGALAAFKEAVATDTSSGLAQLYMGLALIATGDLRNAEKAVRGGLAAGADFAAIGLRAMFRDAKEQARFAAALDKAGPLAAALGHFLLGDRAKARERAEAAAKEADSAVGARRLLEALK